MGLPHLLRSAEAQLPTGAGRFRAFAFAEQNGGKEHLALLTPTIGALPLVRLHSECLTGDALGSLRCDCGLQLDTAMQQIATQGGVLLYLRQEGRGIGLFNKMSAYALQDGGLDTLDANLHLGFGADQRDYAVAAAMLHELGCLAIRLLTNNPAKVDALMQHGIQVVEQVPLVMPPNEFNLAYLRAKRDRMHHRLDNLNGDLR